MAVEKSENQNSQEENNDKKTIKLQEDMLAQMQAMAKKIEELESRESSPSNNKDLVEALAKALSSKSALEQLDATGYLDESMIDKEDVLDKDNQIKFYAHVSTYVIVDDLRNGTPVRTPYGNTIKFEYEASKSKGAGRHEEREHFCVYKCRSKKEADWLENHSLFGVMFFRNAGEALSTNSKKATKMAILMKSLMAQDKYTIINMCRQNNIEMREDVSEMRMALANKLTEDILDKEQLADETRLREQVLEAEAFNK